VTKRRPKAERETHIQHTEEPSRAAEGGNEANVALESQGKQPRAISIPREIAPVRIPPSATINLCGGKEL